MYTVNSVNDNVSLAAVNESLFVPSSATSNGSHPPLKTTYLYLFDVWLESVKQGSGLHVFRYNRHGVQHVQCQPLVRRTQMRMKQHAFLCWAKRSYITDLHDIVI